MRFLFILKIFHPKHNDVQSGLFINSNKLLRNFGTVFHLYTSLELLLLKVETILQKEEVC
jgi:hypothetical protein